MVLNPELMLKIIVAVHFFCTSMINMAAWLPFGYTMNQLAILFLGGWVIVNDHTVIQVELMIATELISVLLDCVAIGMYFDMGRSSFKAMNKISYFGLSAFFTFLLLFLKPAFLFLLYKLRQYRMGETGGPKNDFNQQQNISPPGYLSIPDNNGPN